MTTMRKLFTIVALAACGLAAAQAPSEGDLLVATPSMSDPNFAESVLLVLQHTENGSIAVLINRPTRLAPVELFPEIEGLEAYEGRLFYGGPVLPTRLLLLLRDPPIELDDGLPVFGNVFLSGDPDILAARDPRMLDDAGLRLYAGHAAWGPGQLEAEIADGGWTLMPARTDLVFAADPLGVWERALAADPGLVVSRGAAAAP